MKWNDESLTWTKQYQSKIKCIHQHNIYLYNTLEMCWKIEVAKLWHPKWQTTRLISFVWVFVSFNMASVWITSISKPNRISYDPFSLLFLISLYMTVLNLLFNVWFNMCSSAFDFSVQWCVLFICMRKTEEKSDLHTCVLCVRYWLYSADLNQNGVIRFIRSMKYNTNQFQMSQIFFVSIEKKKTTTNKIIEC